MFISFIIAKNGKEPSCPSTVTSCGPYMPPNTTPQERGMNSWHGQQVGWSQGNYIECKKPISKDYILYSSIYVTFSKCCNYRDGKQISGCQAWRLWGEEGVTTKGRHDGTAPHLHCGGGGCAKVRGIKSPWTIVCRCTREHTHTHTCTGEYVYPGEIRTSSLDCSNARFMVLLLSRGSMNAHTGEGGVKGPWDLSVPFFVQLPVDLRLFQNKKIKKSQSDFLLEIIRRLTITVRRKS